MRRDFAQYGDTTEPGGFPAVPSGCGEHMTRLLHDHAGTGLCAVAPSGRVLGASGLFLRALGLAALPPGAMLHDLLPLADGCPPCAGWHWLIEPSPPLHHPASLPSPHEMQGDAPTAPAPSGQRPTPAPARGGVLVRTLAMEEARAIPGCPDLRAAAGAPAGQAASAARMGVLLQLHAPDLPLLPDLPGVPSSPATGPLQPEPVADAPQPVHAPDPSHVHPAAPPATPNVHLRQALDALAVGLGHDFGNVVASVLGFAEIAISRLHAAPQRADDPHPAVDPMVVRSLDNIVLGCQRAKEVIAFAQSIAGRVDLTAEPADLRPLVTAWCAELAGELPPEARWAVSCGLPAQKPSSENPAPDRADADRLPLVRVDAARLREAFAEIWRNAAWSVQAGQSGQSVQAGQSGQPEQTTTQGHHAAAAAPVSAPIPHPVSVPPAPSALRGDDQAGRILVETALVPPSPCLPGRWLRIRVRDTGQGMDADTLCRMRDPYFSTKARHEGKGRGLARAAGIVRAHGGRLDVAAGPGLGCMVDILLPVPDGV